jgi:hypothetical protein
MLALAAGCGGAGGPGTSTTPQSPGGTGPESAYLLAEFVATDSNEQFVRVWDPAHPGTAVQDVRIVESNGIAWTASRLVFSDATAYDPATRSVRTLGHAKVFFDNDGRLYAIDLRGGQPHAPVQLSSATDVHGLVRAIALGADGADAWVDVQGSGHDWAIRSTMGAAAAPQSVASLAALRDPATGLPQYLFVSFGGASGTAVQPNTFGVRDLAFGTVAVPAVDAMGNADRWLAPDPAQGGVGYLQIAGQLRVLRWGAGGVSVDDGSLHAFAPGFLPPPVAADASTLYVADQQALLAVAGGVVRTVGSFGRAPDALVDAGAVVAAAEFDGRTASCCTSVETLAKADGTRTTLVDAAASVHLWGGADAGVLLSGSPWPGGRFVLAHADGTIDQQGAATQAAGLVRSATARLDQPAAPLAMLSCVADASQPGFCAAGALTQVDIASGASTSLGTLAARSFSMQAEVLAGLPSAFAGETFLASPGGFAVGDTDVRDAWQLTPGVGGSLVRVTSALP